MIKCQPISTVSLPAEKVTDTKLHRVWVIQIYGFLMAYDLLLLIII